MTAPQETSDSQPPVTESKSQFTAAPPPRPIPLADPVTAGLPSLLARLWRFAMVLSHNEETAAELVQKTCLRALQRSDQFEAGTQLDRWTFSIMASLWKNELRAERIRRGGGFVEAEEALIADNREKLETQIFLNQVLTSLPEAQRSTVLLVYVEGLTYAEAAATLAVPLGTVMSRLANARLRLADLKRAGGRQIVGHRKKAEGASPG
ncbi:RNA polymerase sigma factor [Denitrobaculum tricleocarpae]|uniref:RNA polymerase sigma factor n=1 Tax=Denitrobaculum tricleocarpae TaxID=2591009 RepID=A0A545TYL9_9PROT|nr:RNA polymerase sigma factor [Denitrobaculum tricleocarpae]TQV82273.1 RNA polymerase sigma factor [Denitrobaculum tricleocarpae]